VITWQDSEIIPRLEVFQANGARLAHVLPLLVLSLWQLSHTPSRQSSRSPSADDRSTLNRQEGVGGEREEGQRRMKREAKLKGPGMWRAGIILRPSDWVCSVLLNAEP
jgi:hypothetical protein